MMSALQYPVNIDWEVTSSCNHSCIHCYNHWRFDASSTNSANSSVPHLDIARKIAASKPVTVQITGGEPLLVWNEIAPAARYLRSKDISVGLNTNASLVTDEIATTLKNLDIKAFVSIPCSREDVFNKIVGSRNAMSAVVAGIDSLLSRNVDVSLNMVVTKSNLPFIFETAKYTKERFGAQYFSATKACFPCNASTDFLDQILNRKEFNTMLDELGRIKEELGMRVDSAWVYSLCGIDSQDKINQLGPFRRCRCGCFDFVVDSTGMIKACGCNALSYGQILDTSFTEAIRRMEAWRDGSILPEECKLCHLFQECGGGCRSEALAIHGCFDSFDSTASPFTEKLVLIPEETEFHSQKDLLYRLNAPVKRIEDGKTIRISKGPNCEYISSSFYEFLEKQDSFSAIDLQQNSRQDSRLVMDTLKLLVEKKLLVTSKDRRDREPLKQSVAIAGFYLILDPYEPPGKTTKPIKRPMKKHA